MPNPVPNHRLIQALAYHENAAATLRAALALLDGAPHAKSARKATNGHAVPAMFEAALAIDATRRGATAKKPGKAGKARSGAPSSVKVRAQRQQTADRLAQFDRHIPRLLADVPGASGILVAKGYLETKGDGYVRTKKPFVVDTRPGAKT